MKNLIRLMMLAPLGVWAQWENNVVFAVDGDSVTAGEFAAVYNKNRDIGQEIDPKSPSEYLDLYINFKLKVREAIAQGLDTLPHVRNEFLSHRRQLAKPYMLDKNTDERLVFEAWERSKNDVRASHIMIAVAENASPEDTIKAYRRMVKVQSLLAADNSNFSDLAREYSQDEYSARMGGDLGYFNVFDMVYPFENAAYQTQVNQVSEIIRSRFGYHIVMPTDKRIARGEITVAHIMTVANANSKPDDRKKAEEKINEVYKKLKGGENFDQLARMYSEDKSSAAKGGELQPFGINAMVPEFEEAAFSLMRVGDISEPFRTEYGYHIIKVLGRSQQLTFEEAKAGLQKRVQRDERSNLTRQAAVNRLKKEYRFRIHEANLKAFIRSLPNTFYQEGYTIPTRLDNKPLFSLNGKDYGQRGFAQYLSENFKAIAGDSKEGLALAHFDAWSAQEILSYEDGRLEEKYPEFRYLVDEYRNGILLFELLEREIWTPSMTDTAGLTAFFENNRDQYMFPKRAVATVYGVQSDKDAVKLQKALNKGKSVEKLLTKANKKNPLNITIESERIIPLEDFGTDWTSPGAYLVRKQEMITRVFDVKEIKEARHKELNECWGSVSADYQVELENEWIKALRSRFEVHVFEDAFMEVERKLEQ